MSRVHDMGGRFGDGPIDPGQADDPVFEQDWHARALALTLAAGALGQWNLDISRHSRERLSPKDYARFSYYEKWLAGVANLLVENGVVTPQEFVSGIADGTSDLAARKLRAEAVAKVLASGGPVDRDGPSAQFDVGDIVRTQHPARNAKIADGHTRLPSYAAGQTGRIVAVHGCHVFPDSHAHGYGEDPKPIYAVAFDAADLWGAAEQDGDEVILDLWEPYLDRANG